LLFWWGIGAVAVLMIVMLVLGDVARSAGRQVRRAFRLVVAPLFLVLMGLLTVSALGGLFSSGGMGALRFAGISGMPILVGVIAMVASAAAAKRTRRRLDDGRPLPGIVALLTEPAPEELPDAPVGRARDQVDVAQLPDSLRIAIPTRRSTARTVFGLALMVPGVFLLLRLIYVLLAAAFAGASATALLLGGSIGVMGNVLINLPFWLAGAFGAYVLFGQEVVSVDRHGLQAMKTVWGMSFPGATLPLDRPPIVRSQRDQQLHWVVHVASGIEGDARTQSIAFGASNLTQKQSDTLAAVIDEYYSTPSRLRSVSNPGVNLTAPGEVDSSADRA